MTAVGDLTAELVTFVRTLEASGVRVPADGTLAAAEAWVALDERDREGTRVALRSTLVTRESDFERFDHLFAVFWRRINGADDARYPEADDPGDASMSSDADRERSRSDQDANGDLDSEAPDTTTTSRPSAHSAPGRSGETAISRYSPSGESERVSADSVAVRPDRQHDEHVRRFVRSLADQRGRRWERDPTGRAVDGPRALRRSLATGGAVVPLPRRAPKRTTASGVLFVDVSGSVLDVVDRGFLLQFIRSLSEHMRSTRVFFFDTALREVTEAFAAPTLTRAVRELERAEAVWGGGTRIGEALDTVRRDSPAAVDWTTTVIVVSDGLERGDVDRLEGAMAWLSRRAGRVLWLNPLAVSPEYEPAARGMRAALPHVDGFYGFAGLEDLSDIADSLRIHGPDRTFTASRTATATHHENVNHE